MKYTQEATRTREKNIQTNSKLNVPQNCVNDLCIFDVRLFSDSCNDNATVKEKEKEKKKHERMRINQIKSHKPLLRLLYTSRHNSKTLGKLCQPTSNWMLTLVGQCNRRCSESRIYTNHNMNIESIDYTISIE